jgi:hypothetical protein
MTETPTCLGFHVECSTLLTGGGVVFAGFVLFIGSVYVVLAAVFGRWLGYLILAVCFAGWMVIQSSLWLFGFWSQGPGTKTNLGPRGADAAWLVLNSGLTATSEAYPTFDAFPDPPWAEPNPDDAAEEANVTATSGAATTYLSEQANAELGMDPLTDLSAITPTQFTVDNVEFADSEDGTQLAVVVAHFNGGGPRTVVSMYYDGGSVPRYSYMFLAGSVILFLIHVPLLDRAEKKRKEFLTGGAQPPWYGPA